MTFLETVLADVIGTGIVGGGLKFLFDKRIERLRADQALQLEKVRSRLGILSSKVSAAYEKERDILNDTWSKLMKAKGAIMNIASSWIELPDFDRMPSEAQEERIASLDVPEYRKAELRAASAPRRTEIYANLDFEKRVLRGNSENVEYMNFIVSNRFYLGSDLFQKCHQLFREYHAVFVAAKINYQSRDPGNTRTYSEKADTRFVATGSLEKEIEELIENRLRVEEPD